MAHFTIFAKFFRSFYVRLKHISSDEKGQSDKFIYLVKII